MDSRIREIEQWIAEAKQDLGECGREAYISKLYLLDAEIRAIIKEDGSLPATNSPRSWDNNVRRFSLPTTAVAAAVGLLLLTASTVYFTSRSAVSELFASASPTANSGLQAQRSETQPQLIPAGYIPSQIPGEEILPADWEPPVQTAAAELPNLPPASDTTLLAAANQPAPDKPAVQPAATSGSPVTQSNPAGNPVFGAANQATEIALASRQTPTPPTPIDQERSNVNPQTTSLGGEVEHTIATEVPTASSVDLLDTPDDRGFYDQWYVDNGDNSIEELVDEYKDNEHKLNSAELAEKLREVLDKSKD